METKKCKFSLSPDLDRNKIFLINQGELSTQWSPIFYHPERIKYLYFLDEKYSYNVNKLKYLFNLNSKVNVNQKLIYT